MLKRVLEIPTQEALEDFIIESTNLGLIVAKINCRDGIIRISKSLARDVKPEDVKRIQQDLLKMYVLKDI